MKLIFIPSLAARNISATLLDGGMVELRPKAAVTENIRTVFRADKPAILEELRILGNTFSTDELALMAGCTAEDVALLNDVKQIFGGKLDATYKAGSEGGSQNAA